MAALKKSCIDVFNADMARGAEYIAFPLQNRVSLQGYQQCRTRGFEPESSAAC